MDELTFFIGTFPFFFINCALSKRELGTDKQFYGYQKQLTTDRNKYRNVRYT